MNINYKKIATAAASLGLIAQATFPVLGSTTIEIVGNGAGSYNETNVGSTTETNVSQSNTANIDNDVDVDANTGYNDANYNTGGDVAVLTGDADVAVNVVNDVNKNAAEVECCEAQDTNVLIEGNGAYSQNYTNLRTRTENNVDQNNDADIDNDVDVDANTGHNNANLNTGSTEGDDSVAVLTGNAKVSVGLLNEANTNMALISGDSEENPWVGLHIIGNGAGSWNDINANLAKENNISQDNDADIDNDVDVDADTGYNDANFNTAAEVLIDTGYGDGGADVTAFVVNDVNFNYANIDCGCGWDVFAKIAGNGAEPYGDREESGNVIDLRLASLRNYDQGNDADLDNDLEDLDAKTGKNDANSNVGSVEGSDPAVLTGDAYADAYVENSGNSNVIGAFELPDFDWDFDHDFDWDFDMSAFWALFGMSV